MNNLALSVALATAPSSAFVELRERPRSWFPLLLVVVSTVLVVFWYYSIVDIEWLKDLLFSSDPNLRNLSEGERAAAMTMLSRNTLMATSVVSAMFVLPILFLLQALYLLLAARVTKLPYGFKHWLALTCWSALPMLLSNVVAAILLVMSDNAQVSPSVIQPLSINELVLHRPMGSPGHTLLESLTVASMLSWILMIIGVRVWSQRSWGFSASFILLPIVVIYGIWSALAFG